MGNCLNPASKQLGFGRGETMMTREEEETRLSEMKRTISQRQEEEADKAADDEGLNKVKVVLTRAELEWLMAQLNKVGERRLPDVLRLMHAVKKKGARGDGGGDDVRDDGARRWRPRLESILECPETTTA